MRIVRPLAVLLLPALLLAACRPGESEEPPLAVDAVGDAASRAVIAEAVSAGLTGRDAQGQLVPGLAQSWRVSDDGLSIVFRLRPATFVGGRDVTAADAVATIRRARTGQAGPTARDLLAGITEVNAPLEDVVELRLSTPQPEMLEILALPQLGIRSRQQQGKGGRATAGAFLAGPEPINESGERAQALPPTEPGATRLTRNPEYFGVENVAIRAATIRPRTAEQAIQRFNRGESVVVLGGGLEGLGSARVTVRRDELLLEQPRAALLLLLNYRREPLGEKGVRRALQLAVNRQSLGQTFFGTQSATAVRSLSPANVAGYTPPVPDWAHLPFVARQEQARRLLAEAGVDPLVKRLTLTVAITDSPAETRLLEAVAGDLNAIGIDLKLARRDEQAHRRAIAEGDFDLALVRRDSPVDSPLPFLLPNLCKRNRLGICLPEADKLVADSWKAPSRSARLAALAEAERIWAEDGVAIGLVQPLGWSLVSRRVEGFAPNPSGSHAIRHLSISSRKLLK